jgi:WD40 repeat protein/DNA-binding winged helix-turn-helix (wHTH) protein
MKNGLRLDTENACLWDGARGIQLSPKAFAALQCLLDHQGETVSKDVLLDAIWPNEQVRETALASAIRELRSALGDQSKNPTYVETQPRLGYRWIGPTFATESLAVEPVAGESSTKDENSQPLSDQFEQLSVLEQTVTYWLAIHRTFASLTQLKEDIFPAVSKPQLLDALESLDQRSFLDQKSGQQYALQPMVMDYVTQRLIEQISHELTSRDFVPEGSLLICHALVSTTAKPNIRDAQMRLILAPIAQQFQKAFRSPQALQFHLQRLIEKFQETDAGCAYGTGNIINLARYLSINLAGWNFAGLSIWHANLQGTTLPNINFETCEFTNTILPQISLPQMSADLGEAHGVYTVAWSPDDRLLASGGEDHAIRLWDPQTGSCLQTLQGHSQDVWSVAWSPDSQLLASASGDHTIKLWDCLTGKCLKTLTGYEDRVLSVAWCPVKPSDLRDIHHAALSPEAALATYEWVLAGGSAGDPVKLWDTRTGKQLHDFPAQSNVWSVAWSADGATLASGSADAQIRLWERQTGNCVATLRGHNGLVWAVAWRRDHQILASGSEDRTIILWDLKTCQPIRALRGHREAVRTIAWSPSGRILASGSHDGEIRLWDIATGKRLKVLSGHRGRVYALAWSHDGQTLISSGADATILLWDVAIGICLRTLSAEYPYQGTNIKGVTGLTTAQQSTLVALGAISL